MPHTKSEIFNFQFSTGLKKYFLLAFTLEAIKHSISEEVIELESVLKKEHKTRGKGIREKLREIAKPSEEIEKYEKKLPVLTKEKIRQEEIGEFKKIEPPGKVFLKKEKTKFFPEREQIISYPKEKKIIQNQLIMPEIRFPPRLQYLRPYPTEAQIDLGSLNILARDPNVKSIECDGSGQNIIVMGNTGNKKTNIIFTKEEIESIINTFSTASKIPAQEGVFKVAVGRFIFSAVISDVIGSKFIIRKMEPLPTAPRPMLGEYFKHPPNRIGRF